MAVGIYLGQQEYQRATGPKRNEPTSLSQWVRSTSSGVAMFGAQSPQIALYGLDEIIHVRLVQVNPKPVSEGFEGIRDLLGLL